VSSDRAHGRAPGKATSFDIAFLAGVSQPTVSRALRGSPSVREETRKRVEAIAQQLNYKVDKNASNLRCQRSNTLALLLFEDPTSDDSLINPFFHSMLGSITRACAQRGYDLLISFQQQSGNWHEDYEDTRKADGLILLGYGDYLEYRGRLARLVEQGTHFVLWGAVQAGQPGLTVGSDNYQGGYTATRHLTDLGRHRIAFLGNASSHSPEFLERYRGHVQALRDAGASASTASDLIAIGAMHALQECHIDVPAEVSVVGFDDIPAASLANPPLTTVAQDTRLAGEVLVDTLLRQIRNEPMEGATMLSTRLVVRRSCGAGVAG